jgi:hypothetical protein
MQGGEFVPKEESEKGHTGGANSLYNTWFVGGKRAYISGLRKEKSHIVHMWIAVEKTTYKHGLIVR